MRTPEIARLFEHARLLAAEPDYELKEGSVRGGSDGNFIAGMGVPVLDGLAVDGAGAHAEHDHIIIEDTAPNRIAHTVDRDDLTGAVWNLEGSLSWCCIVSGSLIYFGWRFRWKR